MKRAGEELMGSRLTSRKRLACTRLRRGKAAEAACEGSASQRYGMETARLVTMKFVDAA